MKQSLVYLAALIVLAVSACGDKTSSSESTATQSSDNGVLITCNNIGNFRINFKNYDEIVATLGKSNVSDIEQVMDGDRITVSTDAGNFEAYLNDDGSVMSVSVYQGNFITENGIRPGMSLEQLEKALGGAFEISYNEEGGIGPIFKLQGGCIIGILSTSIAEKHIVELMPDILKQQGTFKSDNLQFRNTKPYLSELRILKSI